jgi:hypothetical protein
VSCIVKSSSLETFGVFPGRRSKLNQRSASFQPTTQLVLGCPKQSAIDEALVHGAHSQGSFPADAEVQQTAIHVRWIESVL